MSMDVSRLGIVVESTGIREAATALQGRNGKGGLAGAAEKAETNVNKLTASLGKLLAVNTTATTAAWASAMGQLGTSIQQVGTQLNGIVAQLNAVTAGMNTVAGATQRATKANEEHSRGSHVVMNTLKALATVSTVYAAINVAGSIVKQADAWQMMQARLQNATGSLNNAKVAQQQMFDLSQKIRTPLEDNVRLYARMAPSMQKLGKSAEDTKNVVEGVATALQLSGASGAEMSSVMTQLSQSFGSGVLNGAEFTAVAENGSAIMQALEEHTGKSKSELKKLGSEGKLSIQTVNDAILKALPKWREQFENLPVTFEGGVQRIKNAWTKAIGEMGQDTKFNSELSKSLRIVEDMIPMITKGLAQAFIDLMKWVKANKDIIGQIWDQVIGLIGDVYNLSKSFASWIGAIIGAGEQFSLIGAIIYGVRLGLAAIIDGTKVIASAFVNVGLAIGQALLSPIQLILKGLAAVQDYYANIFELAAKGARALGMDTVADKLQGVSDAAGNLRDTFSGWNKQVDDFFDKGHKMADSWIEDIARGEGAVGKLLNGTKELNKEAAKTQGVMDGTWKQGKPGKATDDKADKAAAREQKHFEDAMVQANAALKAQEELNRRLEQYGLSYDKLGPAQKKVIELQEEQVKLQGKGHTDAERAHNATLIAIYKEAAAYEVRNERMKEGLQADAKSLSQAQDRLKAIEEAASKAEDKLAHFGEAKGATDQDVLDRLKNELAGAQFESTFSNLATPADIEHGNAMVEVLTRMVEAQQRLTDANRGLGANETMAEFEKLMDPKKAEKFGDVLANGFGRAGKAIGDMVKGMQSFETRMGKVNKAWKLVNEQTDPTKKAKMSAQAAQLEEEAWVSTYADMASAAKGFFEEGSRGYKAMEAVEKGFRVWQMAMQVKSFMQELGLIEAVTVAKVAGDQTQAASATASAATQASAAMVAGQANAVAGVANQANGDPYSAFARMAVMAAIMVALGFAVGGMGGGGKSVSAQRQAQQGTGTVLGDAGAKSESISKSLEYLSENSDIALRYSSGMLSSLQNIEYALTGATNAILRNDGGITGKGVESTHTLSMGEAGLFGGTIGIMDKLLFNGAIGKFLGFGTKTSLQDSGITFDKNQNVGGVLNGGINGSVYQDIEKKHDAFGFTYSRSHSRNLQALDPALENEFNNVIEGMVNSITGAAEALGFSAEEVKARLLAANIDIGDISLKGLNAEEIQKQLEAVFSAFGDKLVSVGIGSAVNEFQKAGEGLLETAVRVASGVEQAGYELEKLGLTAIDFRDIINKSGDVAAEIVRQSIMLEEQGTGVGEIIDQMQGSAGDIADVYKQLVGVRDSLQMLGIADDVTRELIRAAGGLDAMRDALSSYTDNFFSDAEKNAMNAASLTKEFDKLGLTMPTTKEGFRALVESLSATGADGQELAMKVLLLSDAFADLMDNTTAAIENARSDLSDAYERESQALMDTKQKFEEFSKSLGEFKDNLLTGDLSTENPLEKYMLQKAKYEDVAARAAAGDETALADFESVAQAFLEASRDVYASGDQYTSDFERVLAMTQGLEQDTAGQASVAQQSLDALNAQVEGLLTINESVLTVTEAIAALQEVMALGLGIEDVDGSHANGLASVPYDGYIAELHKGERVLTAEENRSYGIDYSQYGSGNTTALVEEIKALRAEVCALKDGQREQTGALIAANYDAQERNAQIIVEGHQDAARTSNYTERAQVKLA